MPQISLEYTSNIKINFEKTQFFTRLHQIIHKVGNCELENCKSRLIEIKNYFIGSNENKNSAFIHLKIHFMEGRSKEIKKNLGNELISFLQKNFVSQTQEPDLQITVHIIDIESKNYFKFPKGTLTRL